MTNDHVRWSPGYAQDEVTQSDGARDALIEID